MQEFLQSASRKSERGTGLLLAGIGLLSVSLAGVAGWLYFDLSQTQTELAATFEKLMETETALAEEKQQSTFLTEAVSVLEAKVSGLDNRNLNLRADVKSAEQKYTQATQSLKDQEVISECMTAIVGAIAMADTEHAFYELLLPYEATCTEAVELM